ncbi:MAG: Metal-dependent hydrolase of the beta-lactamase superfamily [Labilithrix sp.]|nr:Metal-dependent hydrolase of the beta-lactamase superfamily [Labilithrix sp.]
MFIRFWGVRGSIASPGPETAGVGGNTSCVEVVCGKTRIVLDAGTGLRGLGNHLLRENEPLDLTLLLSHYHWDHIQGLPFFVPVYMKQAEITIVGGANGVMSVTEALAHQMTAPVFPVRLDEASARLTTREVKPAQTFDVGEAKVTVAKGNHPGGVLAYRIEHEGQSLVYATDTEHYAGVDPALRALALGADVLIYDSQYSPEEYPSRMGWGHSTYREGAALASSAGVGQYVLFHHDPARTDEGVAAFETAARDLYAPSVAAREGMILDLQKHGGGRERRTAA